MFCVCEATLGSKATSFRTANIKHVSGAIYHAQEHFNSPSNVTCCVCMIELGWMVEEKLKEAEERNFAMRLM